HRGEDAADAARLRDLPAVLAHARADRDDRGRARLCVGRPVHAGPGRLRAAGDRGLARGAVRRTHRPGPRGHRGLPDGLAPPAPGWPSATTWRTCATTAAPSSPCTSAGWGRVAATSTTTWPAGSATRPRPRRSRTPTWTAARTRPPPWCPRNWSSTPR